jgi:uncharacterized protein YidB (DUF937 family)
MRTFASLVALFPMLAFVSPAVASLGWPEAVGSLSQLRTQAQNCVELLKSSDDKAAIATGRIRYGTAKAQADGVIAGLIATLVDGGEPESFLKAVCDAAVKATAAEGGTKGVIEEIAKGTVGPLVDALKSAAGAVWTRHVEKDKLETETIKTQLEAAKWPDFGDVAPAR